MNRSATLAVTIAVAVLSIAGPIVVAIQITNREALNAETAEAMAYAREVVIRSEATIEQINEAIDALISAEAGDPCSDASIALMRQIDVVSSYIQAIGRVSGTRLECSSLGAGAGGLDLGPIDLLHRSGVSLRTDFARAEAGDTTFLVIERDGYAAIVHKRFPIDVTTQIEGISLAAFAPENDTIIASSGTIRPDWIAELAGRTETTFLDGDYLVAVVQSDSGFVGAIAALPIVGVQARVGAIALKIVPIGVLAGALLALAVFFLARSQLALPSVIRSALRRNEFYLAYQPIVDLQTGRWVGAEALLRWRRSTGELMPPDLFIPVAEATGLIKRVTERVTQLVVQEATGLFRGHRNFYISINLSSADMHHSRTIDMLEQMANQLGAQPGNVMVEITERSFTDPVAAGQIIRELRGRGIQIAIDDFGTGYSSLAYLEQMRPDCLKIDRSFVVSIGTEAATGQVVPHIIDMARTLGLTMIAEGVETEEQADFLRERGVRYAQGWLFAKAMPFEQLLAGLNHTAGGSPDRKTADRWPVTRPAPGLST